MSVRLEPCEWTREDEAIVLCRILRGGRLWQVLRTMALYGDDRDANMMLLQMRMAKCLKPAANYIRAMDLPTWQGLL